MKLTKEQLKLTKDQFDEMKEGLIENFKLYLDGLKAKCIDSTREPTPVKCEQWWIGLDSANRLCAWIVNPKNQYPNRRVIEPLPYNALREAICNDADAHPQKRLILGDIMQTLKELGMTAD